MLEFDAVNRALSANYAVQGQYILDSVFGPGAYRVSIPFTSSPSESDRVYTPSWAQDYSYSISVPSASGSGLSAGGIYSDIAGFFNSGVKASQDAAIGSQLLGLGGSLISAAILIVAGVAAFKVLK